MVVPLISAKLFDFAGGALGGVGGDPLQHCDPLFQAAQLRFQASVLVREQLYSRAALSSSPAECRCRKRASIRLLSTVPIVRIATMNTAAIT
jgi:hypothetical protein